MIVETMTTTVVPTTSFFVGQLTFVISDLVSRKKSLVVSHHCFGFATIEVFSVASICFLGWQAKRGSNPQPAVLETAALPIELLACNRPQKAEKAQLLRLIPPPYFVSR